MPLDTEREGLGHSFNGLEHPHTSRDAIRKPSPSLLTALARSAFTVIGCDPASSASLVPRSIAIRFFGRMVLICRLLR